MAPGIQPLLINDFSGGWNPRDAFSELANNESPDCLNVSLDERGGVVKRLGLTNLSGVATPLSNAASSFFVSPTGNYVLVQDGAAVKKTTDFVAFSTIKTYSTSARAQFCDFNGKTVAVHPVDKVSTYDGTTWTDVATSPAGTGITVWQNKVWVINGATFYASAISDPTSWTMASDFNVVREKDGAPLTAIGVGQGMDVVGRPGLFLTKDRSCYRVNTSASGASFGSYTTLSDTAGASGPNCIASSPDGLIAFINEDGIYTTDGLNQPEFVSRNLTPLFRDNQLYLNQSSLWAAGTYGDRFVFSVTRGNGQMTNNFTLEYHPKQGWFVPHDFGCSVFSPYYLGGSLKLYGGNPTAGKLYQVFKGGSDDGTPIASRYQTRWFEPAGGYEVRMRRLTIEGRGSYDVYTKGNYTTGAGVLSSFAAGTAGSLWGAFSWGSGTWGASLYEDFDFFHELGVARSVSFNLTETSSTSALGPRLLQDGTSPEIGAFALYGLKLDFIRLGNA